MSTFESKLIKENQKLLKKLDQQTQQITEQNQKIQQLTEQVEFLTKKLYGSSSEKTKIDENQLSLFEDPSLEDHEIKVKQTEEITYRRRKSSGRKAELIKDLPVKEIHCQLHGDDCLCAHCGNEMKQMGKKSFVKKSASCLHDYIKNNTLATHMLVIVMMNRLKRNRFVVLKHQKLRFNEALLERVC